MQFLPLAPSGWPQDVQKRYPHHLWMQKSGFPKKLVFLEKSQVFSLGIPVKIPLFRSEAATASHLDSKNQSDPWVTPLPHFTKNSKNLFSLFSLLSSLFSLLSSLFPPRGQPFSVPYRHSWTEPLRLAGGQFLTSLFYIFSTLFCHICLLPCRIRFLSTRPCASPSLARRNARSD